MRASEHPLRSGHCTQCSFLSGNTSVVEPVWLVPDLFQRAWFHAYRWSLWCYSLQFRKRLVQRVFVTSHFSLKLLAEKLPLVGQWRVNSVARITSSWESFRPQQVSHLCFKFSCSISLFICYWGKSPWFLSQWRTSYTLNIQLDVWWHNADSLLSCFGFIFNSNHFRY